MLTLLVITYGRRHCLERTLAAADEALLADFDQRIIVNDSLDPAYWAWLDDAHGSRFTILHPDTGKRGFAGAIDAGWRAIGAGPGHVFHLEDDFVMNRTIPVPAMIEALEADPTVAQVALIRQAWNDRERAAGGLVAAHPDDYRPAVLAGHTVLLNRRCFTTNPCVYRRGLVARRWPQTAESEGLFTHELLAAGFQFALWGDGAEWVTHIGDERVGCGY